ncbi:hypothetical protein Y1Q_0015768 [Alligator mississippiensis]|uniref:Uncharacterized protein n=1 Tax=Alligator mississippiensis TaxID=8496 RepID=A0A151P718_ALLMI|nr:hypothetical protein Y1Q_0015768 [Alligator mississippiensis]
MWQGRDGGGSRCKVLYRHTMQGNGLRLEMRNSPHDQGLGPGTWVKEVGGPASPPTPRSCSQPGSPPSRDWPS